MKRTLVLFLALLMALALCACGGKGDEIELSLDNYETYLEVQTLAAQSGRELQLSFGEGLPYPGGVCVLVSSGGGYYLSIKGRSENFNYNDVKVVAHVTGNWEYRRELGPASQTGKYGNQEVDLTLEATGDITGQGEDRKTFEFPADCYSCRQLANCNVEIVEVSGSLTPA